MTINEDSMKAFVRGIYYLAFTLLWAIGIYWWYGFITTDTPFYETVKREFRCGSVVNAKHTPESSNRLEKYELTIDFDIPNKTRKERETIDVTKDTFLDNPVGSKPCFKKDRDLPIKEVFANIWAWLVFIVTVIASIVIIIGGFKWAFEQ